MTQVATTVNGMRARADGLFVETTHLSGSAMIPQNFAATPDGKWPNLPASNNFSQVRVETSCDGYPCCSLQVRRWLPHFILVRYVTPDGEY